METNEIMTTNESVIDEVTTEIANVDSGKAGKIVAGAVATVLVGGLIYKFVVKPLVAKHKAKKEAKANEVIECDNYDECDVEVDAE